DSVQSIEFIDPQSREEPKPVFISQIQEKDFALQLLRPKFKFKPPENFSLKSLLADKENQQLLQKLRQRFSSWDNIENILQRQEFTVTELNKILLYAKLF